MKKIICLVLSLLMCFTSVHVVKATDDVDNNVYSTPLRYNIDTSSYNNSKLNAAVKKITSQITSDMTALEKIMFVHDYIILNAKYDYDNSQKNSVPDASFTAYGCLVLGIAVAQGYAEAFDLVMEKLKIDCVVVSSKKMNHAWNLVKVDGNWYHVDLTKDDPARDRIGFAYHKYFLLSDKAIAKKEYSGWNTSYKCTSTKYDGAFWSDVDSAFYIHDGWWYCSDSDGLISKSKGLLGTRYEYMDLSKCASNNWTESFIYDGSYFYIETNTTTMNNTPGYDYGRISQYGNIKRISIDDKKIETVFKKERQSDYNHDGYIEGLLYKDGKYYYQEDDVVKEFNPHKVIQKSTIDVVLPSINIVINDRQSDHKYYTYDLYDSEPQDTLERCYSKDASIVEIKDGFIIGRKLGKTQIVIEGENGVKKSVDVNVVNTVLDFNENTPDVLYVGRSAYIQFDFVKSNSSMSKYDVVFTSSNSSILKVSSGSFDVTPLKAGIVTLTLTAPDKTSVSKTFKVVDKKGWHEYNGHKYYIDSYGSVAVGKTKIGNDTYYFDYDGKMHKGWYVYRSYYPEVIDNLRYYDKDGKMAKGWHSVDKKISYFNTETGNLEKSLSDVNSGKWYYTTVVDALKSGLMSGTGETTFSPEENMTRGMIVTVLHRIAGKPNVAYTGKFKDVSRSSYCATAVEWAAKNKVVSGYSNGKFGPNDNITRQDVAVILYNYARTLGLDVKNNTDLSKFKDYKNVSSYAKPAMQWAVSVGILSGSTKDGKTYLNPKDNASRAECAKMLLVASKLYK